MDEANFHSGRGMTVRGARCRRYVCDTEYVRVWKRRARRAARRANRIILATDGAHRARRSPTVTAYDVI
jgi:hypothetical protein